MVKAVLSWLGTLLVTEVATWLTWKQVAIGLPWWSQWLAVGLVAFGFLLGLPTGKDEDGSTQRLYKTVVRGRHNATQVTTGDASPISGNFSNTGKGTQTIHGLPVTLAELRQQSLDVSRAVILPEARGVASSVAIAEINNRTDFFLDKVIQRFNETNPDLFARWDDPRFLAAFTSAQRSYAETGDESLADLQAKLVTAFAERTVRTRREIFLRQAIDIAPRLTNEHVNALAVQVFFSNIAFGGAWDFDWVIKALDVTLESYYGGLPSSALDLQYMSSTGVCYTSQLAEFADGPYRIIHKRYRNSMYRSFTYSEVQNLLSEEEDNPHLETYRQLLERHATREEDVEDTPDGQFIAVENTRFRLAAEHVAKVLTRDAAAANNLPEPHRLVRDMILEKSLSEDQFKERIAELKPELGVLFDQIEELGVLNYPLHPVGFVIARHQVADHAPALAKAIDEALDRE